jgi:hypothetical protein
VIDLDTFSCRDSLWSLGLAAFRFMIDPNLI